MDRVVSQLLTEIDAVSAASGDASDRAAVFVIGATNRPDLLDVSLMRPGRFDRLLYLGIAADHSSRLGILRAITRKFCLDQDVDMDDIVRHCPSNFTGADFFALGSNAIARAIKRKSTSLLEQAGGDERELQRVLRESQQADISVTVSQQDFLQSLPGIVPSVSTAQLAHYRRLRQQFSGTQT